jgi:uncharacterized protein
MPMKIAFDPAKDAANVKKHGVSLAAAEVLEWDLLLATEDPNGQYGEARMVGFAPVGRVVYCVGFTEQNEVYRIISLRRALPKEVRDYARHI